MTDLLAVSTFPEKGPYRIDQVHSDPAALFFLFAIQFCLAILINLAARRHWRFALMHFSWLLVLATIVFFCLASWGVGDVTRLSYLFVQDPKFYGWHEPIWTILAPIVRFLPYRFSLLHGCVAGGYAASAIWLSRKYKCASWGGWWALLVVCSPLLRGFLQSGITRQALSALLLLPWMLFCAGGVSLKPMRLAAFSGLSAMSHSSFPLTFLVATAPLITGKIQAFKRSGSRPEQRAVSLRFIVICISIAALALLTWIGGNYSHLIGKLNDYIWNQEYYSSYLIKPEVNRLLIAIAASMSFGAYWSHRKRNRLLVATSKTLRSSILYYVALLLLQLSIKHSWLPQLTSRYQDVAGFYLLILFVTWVSQVKMPWLSVLPVAATIHDWVFGRLALSGTLACGSNDEFLCIPDRLPWDVTYWN